LLRSILIVVGILVAVWLAFVAFVAIARPDETSISDAMRLLPDTARALKRLATDQTIPRRTRWLLWALLGYLAIPIDLIPDFLPVIGYADDAIITSVVLRHVLRRADPSKLQEHWPGTPEGLATLRRLLRLPAPELPLDELGDAERQVE
jgi:uncharacterized membrane protein YkvA (DUF1232 family)